MDYSVDLRIIGQILDLISGITVPMIGSKDRIAKILSVLIVLTHKFIFCCSKIHYHPIPPLECFPSSLAIDEYTKI